MAVAAVFALPELHEAILWQTDMVTLLVSAQRVSKAWRALITASPTLQQRLFFQPVPGDAHPKTATPVADQQGAEGFAEATAEYMAKAKEALPSLTRNPLLVKYFSPCFFETHSKAYFRHANSFMALPWTPNPRKEMLDQDGIMRSIAVDPPEDAYVQPFRERFFRRGASWRRMLVTQPPICQLGYLWNQEKVNGGYLSGNYAIVVKGAVVALEPSSPTSRGLRMGCLYDLVQERVCRHELHNHWFRVHWGGVWGPAYCEESNDVGNRLMAQSRMVVEILEQQFPIINSEKPTSSKVFDDVFRCDEHVRFDMVFGENDLTRIVAVVQSGMRGLLSNFNAVHDDSD